MGGKLVALEIQIGHYCVLLASAHFAFLLHSAKRLKGFTQAKRLKGLTQAKCNAEESWQVESQARNEKMKIVHSRRNKRIR